MDRLRLKQAVREGGKELLPAGLVLVLSLVFQLYWGTRFATEPWSVVYRVFLRFLRYAVFLCLPLYFLGPLYTSILKKKGRTFIQAALAGGLKIDPIKHWLVRPFQGIGISFLFATKLLAVIQIVSVPSLDGSVPFTPGHFNVGRLLVSSGITVVISLLLSTLWTFDDLGVRYFNRKDQELKMIGKYLGTLMPTIFGLYGVFSLYAQGPGESALTHVFRIVIALYPPLVLFAVVHTYFLRKRRDYFLERVSLPKGGVWREKDRFET
jgi:hypothetical protein